MTFYQTFTPAYLTILVPFMMGCWSYEATMQATMEATRSSAENKEQAILELSEQARMNLNLITKAARPTDYWRTITIPGVIADRPGLSDRGLTSPADSVVAEVHVFPGDTVRPGQRLMTLRLFSEYLQSTQTQLFTASQEVELLQEQIDRLSSVARTGAVSASRMIELRNDLQRQQTLIQASTQELLNRGLNPDQIVSVSDGTFVSTIDVLAPPPRTHETVLDGMVHPDGAVGLNPSTNIAYEVQSLGVELGQTVQAGDLLIRLANHQFLYVVGHAYKRDASLLEQAAQHETQLRVEFAEDTVELWPATEQQFEIRHLANTIDAITRTFDFFIPLVNQSRTYQKNGQTFLVWRYRPGQRTRIEVPVEKMSNVFVLPSDGVVHEGPDAFVYRQNGDLFHQISVHIVHQDRLHVVVANDGAIPPGVYLAQTAAASLRRVLKSQSVSNQQPGVHVHADGTVHQAGD